MEGDKEAEGVLDGDATPLGGAEGLAPELACVCAGVAATVAVYNLQ